MDMHTYISKRRKELLLLFTSFILLIYNILSSFLPLQSHFSSKTEAVERKVRALIQRNSNSSRNSRSIYNHSFTMHALRFLLFIFYNNSFYIILFRFSERAKLTRFSLAVFFLVCCILYSIASSLPSICYTFEQCITQKWIFMLKYHLSLNKLS